MRRFAPLFTLLTAVLLLASVRAVHAHPPASLVAPEAPTPAAVLAPSAYQENGVDVDKILDALTLEEKVGQLLLLGFGGTTVDATVAGFLDEMKPGGVALFSRNIDAVDQTLQLIRDVRAHDPAQHAGGIPMFVAVDQEGGTVVRLKKGVTILPSAMALGAAHDPELARRAGKSLGHDLRTFGFNMNLAPVLDVNSNPNNPVIGIRAFGSDPALVADVGVGYIEGLQSEGVLAVAKHFPGHGDTDADSHYHLPVLTHDRDRLEQVELHPFTRAFAEGLDAVMTAHIALPAVSNGSDLPATVNDAVLTGLLRDDLSWDGLVITDGLEMQGIVERFGSGEAAVRAVIAGADMVMVLWFPEKKREVKQSLLEAAQSGRIPAWRLDQAVRRVLVAKAKRGLFKEKLLPLDKARRALDRTEHLKIAEEVAERAVTIVKNDDVLPLQRGKSIVVASTEPLFADLLAKDTGARVIRLGMNPTKERVEADGARIAEAAAGADVVVIAMQTADNLPLVRRVRERRPDTKIVLVSFGSPYLLGRVAGLDASVCTFGFRDDSERAAHKVMTGKLVARGKLPVTLGAGPRLGRASEPTSP